VGTNEEVEGESVSGGAGGADLSEALRLYREMLRIRLFEERLFSLLSKGLVGGTTHLCVGQEGVPVGVSACLEGEDLVTSTHRGHGHLLAKGGRADLLLAEIAGRITGYCKGKGGSQHVAVPEIGHMGSNGITGGGLPIAAGLALAQKLKGTGRCVVAYLGDGAAATGNFHESLNLAAIWSLPIVFVLENNLYAMSTPVGQFAACDSFVNWASRYKGMWAGSVDGNDVLAVRAAAEPLLNRARRCEGPALLECLTYRQSGHSKSDARVYRTRAEEALWKERDPLEVLAKGASLRQEERDRIQAEAEEEIEEAVSFALGSEKGGLEVALSDLEIPVLSGGCPSEDGGEVLSVTEALRRVLEEEMERDSGVLLIGEDIGVYGGAFGVTRGILERFGPERVRETPISESSFVGLSVGAAVGGLRPVAELMFGDFVTCCMDSLVNHAAKLHYMYAGQVRVPFTLRMPVGRRNGYGATHSQSLEAWFTHVPGLQVLFPSRLEDAVGLLRTAIRSDVPVLFLEHKLLYPETGVWPGSDHLVPFGSARIDREGEDLTLLTYGLPLGLCREASEILEGRGFSIEIVDLRSLAPLDRQTCLASIQKTGRVVFVQEATVLGGVCDRVLSDLLEEAFSFLLAPPRRVGGAHCPMPSGPSLEEAIMPTAQKILQACLPLLSDY
jgi:pyruvate/2-oxoglutarate/acetoin dehydrogenase E1 component/TPP-dependent pyruvate/acetoin dehydrogenase alpha subunit